MKRISRVWALVFIGLVPVMAKADGLDDQLAEAKGLLLAGKSEEAEPKLSALMKSALQVLEKSPDDLHAAYVLGVAAMYAGDDDTAEVYLRKVSRADRKNSAYMLALAQLLIFEEKSAEAMAQIQLLIDENGKNVEAWDLIGDAQESLGKLADAQKSYEKAFELAPKDVKYLGKVAQLLLVQKKTDEAIAVYKKAIEVDPNYVKGIANIAQIYQNKAEWQKSLDMYTKLVAITPEDWRALAKQVQLYEALNKPAERDATREKILALKKAGKISDALFCREQMTVAAKQVLAFEYFELKGPNAVRYSFLVMKEDGKTIEKRVSLGSYDATNQFARETGEIKGDERLFHLDVYLENSHGTLEMFKKEPTYEQARELAKQYLEGKLPLKSSIAVPSSMSGGGK